MADIQSLFANLIKAYAVLENALPKTTTPSSEKVYWETCPPRTNPYLPNEANLSRNEGAQHFDKNGNICLTPKMRKNKPTVNPPQAKQALSDITKACALLAAQAQPILQSNIKCEDVDKFGAETVKTLCGTLLYPSGDQRCQLDNGNCVELDQHSDSSEMPTGKDN